MQTILDFVNLNWFPVCFPVCLIALIGVGCYASFQEFKQKEAERRAMWRAIQDLNQRITK
jgi:hypothetical protein